jgi:hypothetical protein
MYRRASLKLCEGESNISRPGLALIKPVAINKVHPIRHIVLVDMVTEWFENNHCKIKEEFHATSHLGFRYIGLFHVRSMTMTDFEWVVVITNNNDGKSALELHSGIVLPEVQESIAFHHSSTVLKKLGFTPEDELKSLVNETMSSLREWFNVEYDRCDAYKKLKLSTEKAHHIICTLLQTEIIAGRVAFELLTGWNNPESDYIKPRTLWSLFVHCLTFTNRLKSIQHIERSKSLHGFFDGLAGFVPKPTKWVQATLC